MSPESRRTGFDSGSTTKAKPGGFKNVLSLLALKGLDYRSKTGRFKNVS